MLLYVKFCGGCNPTFDRGTLVKNIASLLDARTVNSHPEQADMGLLVSGCSRHCAKIPENIPYVPIDHKVDAEKIVEEISQFLIAKKQIGEDDI